MILQKNILRRIESIDLKYVFFSRNLFNYLYYDRVNLFVGNLIDSALVRL